MSGPSYRAPASDYGLLSVPAIENWAELARGNHEFLSQPDRTIGGEFLTELRRRARQSFVECARAWNPEGMELYPKALEPESVWIMTGHQPELYHPGVWAKNFAVASVARANGFIGVNLVADTDQLKSTRIKVPSGSLYRDPKAVEVAFDQTEDGRPYETWRISDEAVFEGFEQAVKRVLTLEVADPLVSEIWPLVNEVDGDNGARRLSLARQSIERRGGGGLLESPMSLWAETAVVRHMFCIILADMPRFHAIHDDHLAAYRKEHRIRSRNHPVADLLETGGWWESPLWVWRDTDPIRRSLWVRICPNGSGIELRIEGESDALGCLSIRPGHSTEEGVEQLARIAEGGVRIRPRALVTTALCRTLLADLFVHGIGGAIYDELGDSIFRQFFGITPPSYAVMSATLRLSDFGPAESHRALEEAILQRRRIEWKAETQDFDDPEVLRLLEIKSYWLSQPTQERRMRRERARQLRTINREIAGLLGPELSEMRDRIVALRSAASIEMVARSREYSVVVHSVTRLRRLARMIGLGAILRGPT